jgi:hypothetical protein
MTPKKGFSAALERAKHLLRLYELICDTRERAVRADWAAAFKQVMHWPNGNKIVRIDGKDRQSIIVFKEECGIAREHFAHTYLSELLRSALVASVSALDRMLHDQVVKHCWKLLSKKEAEIPKKLKALSLSALDAKKALEYLRKDSASRPGSIIKKAIQEKLHREYTFQTPDSILLAAQMLGVDDFWGKVASKMQGNPPKYDVVEQLREITQRRNQIVHEADLIRTNRQEPSLRPITFSDAERQVKWMEEFGSAVNDVIEENV